MLLAATEQRTGEKNVLLMLLLPQGRGPFGPTCDFSSCVFGQFCLTILPVGSSDRYLFTQIRQADER